MKTEEIGFGGLKLIQDDEGFKYGIDAVILADFAFSIFPGAERIVDLGTGNGIIPLILSHKNRKALLTGVEIQESAVKSAVESVRINGLEGRIEIIRADVNEAGSRLPGHEADAVTCNPPYVARGGGMAGSLSGKYIARHETTAELTDFVKAAAWALKDRGHFFMVHRPSRLVDVFCACRKEGLEPKDIRLVCPRRGEAPNIALIHCVAGGGRELRFMKELAVYDNKGKYTDEIERIYERESSIL
ncbi:MAG TPA: tRNA1(Val) (adenine(37)-N6)-methyltransferase [Candidatus Copromorpha excrementigallinarum]|uniref:tRNA1(Val) (Adenine(37)-N6)-methyltransferase n=1 Tax=Candidatus Allocopromorpha excrementigallinarum TaxID=2840742 RepID=A0A9D1L6W2_9FIRM|nr:tRNA1(Val) (adenine(37)-N6)-methyltransferase [Candidatus Copromorpha excrementigallinarum]